MSAQASALHLQVEEDRQPPPSQDAGLRLRMTWFFQGMALASLMLIGVAVLAGSPDGSKRDKSSGSDQPSGSDKEKGLGYPYGMGFMPASGSTLGGLRSTPVLNADAEETNQETAATEHMFDQFANKFKSVSEDIAASGKRGKQQEQQRWSPDAKFPGNNWSPIVKKMDTLSPAAVFMVTAEEAKSEELKASKPEEKMEKQASGDDEAAEMTKKEKEKKEAPKEEIVRGTEEETTKGEDKPQPAKPEEIVRDNSWIPTAADIAKMDDPWGKPAVAKVHSTAGFN